MKCAVSSSGVKQCALCAKSTHDVDHEIVGVNVVIGVLIVPCELQVVVRVHVPLVVCDDAVVRRTLGLIALVVIVVFVVAFSKQNFAVWGDILFTPPVGDSELLFAVTEF